MKNGREGGEGGRISHYNIKLHNSHPCPLHFSLHQGWWLTDGWKSPRLCLYLWVCFCRQLNSSSVCLYCVLFQIFCFVQHLICISAPWSATDGKQTWDSLDCISWGWNTRNVKIRTLFAHFIQIKSLLMRRHKWNMIKELFFSFLLSW